MNTGESEFDARRFRRDYLYKCSRISTTKVRRLVLCFSMYAPY